MAGYKAELDEKISTVGEVVVGQVKYRVSVYRYNKGEYKIAYEYVIGLRPDGSEAARNINTRIPLDVAKFFAESTTKAVEVIDNINGLVKAASPSNNPAAKAASAALAATKKPPKKTSEHF